MPGLAAGRAAVRGRCGGRAVMTCPILPACARAGRRPPATWLDVSGLGQRPLGGERPEQLIHEHGEQHDVADQRAVRAERLCGNAHAERHAGLRQQGHTQIVDDLWPTVRRLGRFACADVLADRAKHDVYHAYEYHRPLGEHFHLELRAADHKEQHEQRSGPAVRLTHQLF